MSHNTSIQPVFGTTNPTPDEFDAEPVKRYGSVIGLNPEKEHLKLLRAIDIG